MSYKSQVSDGNIIVNSIDIEDIIENSSFEELIFHMLQQRTPSKKEENLLRAYIVSLCEHGDTSPSTLTAKITSSVNTSFEMTAIASIATASGEYHFGALKKSMEQLKSMANNGATVEQYIEKKLRLEEVIYGFGHRIHKTQGDPRPKVLFRVINKINYKGRYISLVKRIDEILSQKKGIRANIDGIGAGILLDLGFSPEIAPLFVLISRLPALAKNYLAETTAKETSPYIGLLKRTYEREDENAKRPVLNNKRTINYRT